jgi:hypothetical protein
MDRKLFGIDVSRNGKRTMVRFWRHHGKRQCFYRDIPVLTDSTYDRLFNILPTENSRHFVHAEPSGLEISYLI